MSRTYFAAWARPQLGEVAAAASAAPAASGPPARAQLALQTRVDTEDVSVPLEVVGPADVGALAPEVVARVHPAPGVRDASTGHCPYVEFTAADLPWRYSPAAASGAVLRPWLALLAVRADANPAEYLLAPDGRVLVAASVLRHYDLSGSAAWAHVQSPENGLTAAARSRVLCVPPKALARQGDRGYLEAERDYVALLVGAYRVEAGRLVDAWTYQAPPPHQPEPSAGEDPTYIELRLYHQWSFHTGEAGTFDDLAADLHALTRNLDNSRNEAGERAAAELGRKDLDYGRHLPDTIRKPANPPLLCYQGALGFDPSRVTDPEARVRTDLGRLTSAQSDGERPLLGMPDYGQAWGQAMAPWAVTMRTSPADRASAGLGAWCAREMQDQIVAAAGAFVEQLAVTRQRQGAEALGVTAATALWARRLAPGGGAARLHVLCAAVGGIAVRQDKEVVPLIDLLTGDGDGAGASPLPRALFTSATARLLRPGTGRTRHLQTRLSCGDVLAQANRCPGPPPSPQGLPDLPGMVADLVGPDSKLDLPATLELGQDRDWMLDAWGQDLGSDEQADNSQFAPGTELNLLPILGPGGEAPCLPVDPSGFDNVVGSAFDPRRRPVPVAEEVTRLPLYLEGWRFLRDRAPELLCPGITTLPDASVALVHPNQRFVEAFMLGFNTAALAEMRWRNIPLASNQLCADIFWGLLARLEQPNGDVVDIDGIRRRKDIVDISKWTPESLLGTHAPADAQADVVLIRTPIFRRWPSTAVYLVPPLANASTPDWSKPRPPRWQASLGRDIAMLWFDGGVSTSWLVLQETPPELRFTCQPFSSGPASNPLDGATAARQAFDQQTRVALWGGDLTPPVPVTALRRRKGGGG